MVLVRGRHVEVPDPEPRPCLTCYGADPLCDACEGYGKIYPEVDYDEYAEVFVGDEQVNLYESLAVRNHSPTGFAWGYAGSGPAQLALAILLKVTSRAEAEANYMRFKGDVIARLCKDEPFQFTFDYDEWRDSTDTSGVKMLVGQAY